jgi:hypothetical protein
MNKTDKEKKSEEYLKSLLNNDDIKVETTEIKVSNNVDITYDPPTMEYTYIDINSLPAGRYYKQGTKIGIRSCKVSEIQAYSMVDDTNFIDITEKMNELLSRNIKFIYPDGSFGTFRDLKDADRLFLIFMIREITFQGNNTLTKEVSCKSCNHEFKIPFMSSNRQAAPTTFELYEPNEKIEKFYNKELNLYELVYNGISWRLAPPTIGIQIDFYDEIKRNVQIEKKPDVAFMKIMPFLLYDRNSITEEGIKAKLKQFSEMNDMVLFNGLNQIVNNIKVGIKGLKMICPVCGQEVHTELTFPNGASALFEIKDIFDYFE